MADTGLNLKPAEAAARLRVSKDTLKHWRIQGCGPRFVKWGRVILYPMVELERWEKQHLHTSTNVQAK